MDINNLQREYARVSQTTSFSAHQEFISRLLSSNDQETIQYHFELLRSHEPRDLYLRVRSAFIKRGKEGEKFLIDRIQREKDPALLADALHLLGRLESRHAIPLAREFMSHPIPEHHYIGCYVLGWVGAEDDIPVLTDRLLTDTDSRVRATAATALDQVMIRLPHTKPQLLASLSDALQKEEDEEVIAWVIITIQYIMKRKYGLKENIEEAKWVGDVKKAKIKALKGLHSLR